MLWQKSVDTVLLRSAWEQYSIYVSTPPPLPPTSSVHSTVGFRPLFGSEDAEETSSDHTNQPLKIFHSFLSFKMCYPYAVTILYKCIRCNVQVKNPKFWLITVLLIFYMLRIKIIILYVISYNPPRAETIFALCFSWNVHQLIIQGSWSSNPLEFFAKSW